MEILYLFHFYVLIYYKNISINLSILQYIYVDHHRWHYTISSCNSLLHNTFFRIVILILDFLIIDLKIY